jgi:hypothetical protein
MNLFTCTQIWYCGAFNITNIFIGVEVRDGTLQLSVRVFFGGHAVSESFGPISWDVGL